MQQQEEKKRFFERNFEAIRLIFWVLIGIMILFTALYLFTRPYCFESFDFSQSGPVGDTIGGITAPIINIAGAILVYYSFRAQITANKINFKALSDERESANKESIYQKHVSQFNDIKHRLDNLEFIVKFKPKSLLDGTVYQPDPIVYKGLNALHECILRLQDEFIKGVKYQYEQYETYSILLNYDYILLSLEELSVSIENKVLDKDDKEFLLINIGAFYKNLLRSFGGQLLACFSNHFITHDLLKSKLDPLNKRFHKFEL